MGTVAVAIVVGALLGQFWAAPLLSPAGVVCVVPLAGLSHWLAGPRALALVLAWAWSGMIGFHFLEQVLPEPLWLRDIRLHACITELPRRGEAGTRLRVEVIADAPWGRVPRVQIHSAEPLAVFRAGECRRFLVRLKPPHGQVNPGQFDRHLWLYREGVHATGYIRPNASAPVTGAVGFPVGSLLRLRERLAERLHAWPEDAAVAAVLPAITVGARQWIDAERWRIFQATGTSHLMAISGLHVGMLALAGWWLGRRLGFWLNGRGWPVRSATPAAALCIGLALGYALLAGLAIPTVRAALMAAVVVALRALLRGSAVPRALALVAVVQLGLNPASVLAPGFWLSYGAVGALLLIGQRLPSMNAARGHSWRSRWRNRVTSGVMAQLLLAAALALPGLLFFGRVAWLSPLINLLAIPWFSLVVLPLSLAGTLLLEVAPGLAAPLLTVASCALDLLLDSLRVAAECPLAATAPGGMSGTAWVLLAVGSGLLLAPPPWPRWKAGMPALVMAGLLARWQAPSLAQLMVFDVGQGTAALVTAGSRALLIDTGPSWRDGDAGAQTLLPALRQLGVKQLDMLIVSHGDADHAGGLASVLAGLPVARLVTPPDVAKAHPAALICRRDQAWQLGPLRVRVEHPLHHSGWSRNNGSCAVSIEVAGQRFWFPGDIETPAESVLVARTGNIDAAVALVPHHGSRTSSSPPLVGVVRARYAVVTAGFLNRWGFPDGAVVERWREQGSCVLNTALTGALTFAPDTTGEFRLVAKARADWRRPWVVRGPSRPLCAAVNATKRGL
ncbi:MAG: DNA internalization-related competence protein ComEC/Rec2 [Gammaproteobacteria bacterium]|jgi:competence protein ComEC|nr:DNA internalization-related competence protein ComEC/Rec2 [Gammaproteobacteria bacterium]